LKFYFITIICANLPYSLPAAISLVQFLIQLGPEITADVDVVRAVLERFDITESNPPRDPQVVDIIGTLGRLAAEGTVLFDTGALVRALSSFVCSCSKSRGPYR